MLFHTLLLTTAPATPTPTVTPTPTATPEPAAIVKKPAVSGTISNNYSKYVYDTATADTNGNLVVDTSKSSTAKLLGKAIAAKGQSEVLISFTHASGNVYYVVKNDATNYSYAKKLND